VGTRRSKGLVPFDVVGIGQLSRSEEGKDGEANRYQQDRFIRVDCALVGDVFDFFLFLAAQLYFTRDWYPKLHCRRLGGNFIGDSRLRGFG